VLDDTNEAWPVDPSYQERYDSMVRIGRETASGLDACIVGIARNACPHIVNTLALVEQVAPAFRSFKGFIYENDSTDPTPDVLDAFAQRNPWLSVQHDFLGVEDTRGFEKSRTERLARARNICLEWVRQHASETAWTIVLDLDPHGGFDVDGIFNSIGCLASESLRCSGLSAGGMASYSLWMVNDKGTPRVAHYDAWAARPLCWWDDLRHKIGMGWFSMFLPPVGSRPMPMNSAFGGLCVYYTRAYLAGGYSGEDCEHVPHHKRMHDAGWQLFLNPGCRYIAVWLDGSEDA
jgi:hypothetical protein